MTAQVLKTETESLIETLIKRWRENKQNNKLDTLVIDESEFRTLHHHEGDIVIHNEPAIDNCYGHILEYKDMYFKTITTKKIKL